ncbi:MAG TPA: protein phosphatase 2C domain-containing protein [Blastocatellia bacterium]|nr:protein phosphatase 2C domain-containing protein [Blastocatellia bacterium]
MSRPGIAMIVYAVGVTDAGRVRPANEDAFVIADLSADMATATPRGPRFNVGSRGILLAVSDGMGGTEAGEVASVLTLESLREHLDDTCRASDIMESVRCAVEAANRDVVVAAREPSQSGMGATLVAVVVHRALAHIASVGDSRLYLIRAGKIRQLTKDQSYVEVLIGAGVITREQALTSPYRNVILQAMGQRDTVMVALARLTLRLGDVLLLCSDGLWDKVADDEMLRVVAESASHEQACARLVEIANECGGEDNITVIIAEVAGLELAKPKSSEGVTGTIEVVQEFDPSKAPRGG